MKVFAFSKYDYCKTYKKIKVQVYSKNIKTICSLVRNRTLLKRRNKHFDHYLVFCCNKLFIDNRMSMPRYLKQRFVNLILIYYVLKVHLI